MGIVWLLGEGGVGVVFVGKGVGVRNYEKALA